MSHKSHSCPSADVVARIAPSRTQTFARSSAESLMSSRSEGRRTSGSHTSKVMKRTFTLPEVFNWLFRFAVLDDAECELNCRPVNQKYFARLKEYAVDGTHCTKVHNPPKSGGGVERSVCVEGKCKVSEASLKSETADSNDCENKARQTISGVELNNYRVTSSQIPMGSSSPFWNKF